MTAAGATALLTDFIAGFTLDQVSEPERVVAKVGLMDAVGVAVAGSQHPAGRIAGEFARTQGAGGEVSVWGQGFKAPSSVGVLANGTAAHALDFDDVNWALVGHASASLTPTVIGLAEQLGRSGADALAAYACGFEVMTKLGRALMPSFSLDGGWHATSAIGTIGTAAAAAKLLDLDRTQIRHAIGIAVSQAGGVVQNFGTMTKPFHAGMAAQSGVQAASLAKLGFTSAADAIEGKHGLFRTHGRGLAVAEDWLQRLGQPSELSTTKLVIKPYPCGVAGHPAIDAAMEIRERITPADLNHVTAISILGTSYTIDKMRYAWPANELEAKFSLAYQVAKALIDGFIELRHFTAAALDDKLAERLVSVTSVGIDDDIEAAWRRDGGSRPCRVTVTFDNGRQEEALVRISLGNPEKPLTPEQLRRKFLSCTEGVLSDGAAREAADLLGTIEQLPQIGALTDRIR